MQVGVDLALDLCAVLVEIVGVFYAVPVLLRVAVLLGVSLGRRDVALAPYAPAPNSRIDLGFRSNLGFRTN